MYRKLVREIKPYEPSLIIKEDMAFLDMAKLFVDNPTHHNLCVVDEEGKLKGLIHRKRLFEAVFCHHVAAESRVSRLYQLLTSECSADLMITHFVVTKEDASLAEVIRMLIKHDLNEIPIVDENVRPLGFLFIYRILEEWINTQRSPGI